MALAEKLRLAITEVAPSLWPDVKIPPFEVVPPPLPQFGDLSTALPLTLSKLIQEQPADIAHRIREALSHSELEHIREITVTEPGYLNFIIDFHRLTPHLLEKIY